MRLWHKELITVLPDKQLLGQWRECCAIASNIKTFGFPNHALVNKIMDYKLSHFYKYCTLITSEMYDRGFNISDSAINKIIDITDQDVRMGVEFITNEELFSGWHNERYLKQCLYNLEEKYDCKIISESEWKKIDYVYNNYFL